MAKAKLRAIIIYTRSRLYMERERSLNFGKARKLKKFFDLLWCWCNERTKNKNKIIKIKCLNPGVYICSFNSRAPVGPLVRSRARFLDSAHQRFLYVRRSKKNHPPPTAHTPREIIKITNLKQMKLFFATRIKKQPSLWRVDN